MYLRVVVCNAKTLFALISILAFLMHLFNHVTSFTKRKRLRCAILVIHSIPREYTCCLARSDMHFRKYKSVSFCFQLPDVLLQERDKRAKWHGIPVLVQELYESSHLNSDFTRTQAVLKVTPLPYNQTVKLNKPCDSLGISVLIPKNLSNFSTDTTICISAGFGLSSSQHLCICVFV